MTALDIKLINIVVAAVQVALCKGSFSVIPIENGFGQHKLIVGQIIDNNTLIIMNKTLESSCKYYIFFTYSWIIILTLSRATDLDGEIY